MATPAKWSSKAEARMKKLKFLLLHDERLWQKVHIRLILLLSVEKVDCQLDQSSYPRNLFPHHKLMF
jgi:hypothetical protein